MTLLCKKIAVDSTFSYKRFKAEVTFSKVPPEGYKQGVFFHGSRDSIGIVTTEYIEPSYSKPHDSSFVVCFYKGESFIGRALGRAEALASRPTLVTHSRCTSFESAVTCDSGENNLIPAVLGFHSINDIIEWDDGEVAVNYGRVTLFKSEARVSELIFSSQEMLLNFLDQLDETHLTKFRSQNVAFWVFSSQGHNYAEFK